MKKPKILTSLTRLSDDDLVQKAELIINCLTNNDFFTEPKPAITEIQIGLDEFCAAIIIAKEGSKTETVNKTNKRKNLLALLKTLALYVQFQGNYNEIALLSSGFSIQKKPQTIGALSKPENFVVTPMYVGMIKLRLKKIYGAKMYQYEYKEKDATSWNVVTNSKSVLILSQLKSGIAYNFRVTAIGTAPERIYSNTINSFIL